MYFCYDIIMLILITIKTLWVQILNSWQIRYPVNTSSCWVFLFEHYVKLFINKFLTLRTNIESFQRWNSIKSIINSHKNQIIFFQFYENFFVWFNLSKDMKSFLILSFTVLIAIDLEKCMPKYLLVKLDDTGEKGEFAIFFLSNS